MTNKRGIVDPWRISDPVVEEPRTNASRTGERIDVEDIDHDADLVIPGRFVIRSVHASFNVTSTRVRTPRDALDVLAACVQELGRNKTLAEELVRAGVGVRVEGRTWNAPADNVASSRLTGGNTILWFARQSTDLGMRALARILRLPGAIPICRKHGIVVMLNT